MKTKKGESHGEHDKHMHQSAGKMSVDVGTLAYLISSSYRL